MSFGQIEDSLDKSETLLTNQRLLDKSETVGQIGDSLDRSETPLDRSETPLDRSETPLDRSETSTPPKPSHSNDSSDSPNSYQIFIKSLSNSEREKFLKFGLKKAAQLPKPPTLPQKWVESNFDELYKQFCKENGKQNGALGQDWSEHPLFEKALEAMRQGVPKFKVLGHPDLDLDKETRAAMVEYAKKHNLIWGADS